MTMVLVREDSFEDYKDLTPTSVKVLTYFKDKKCTIESRKLRGKYTKEITYSFINASRFNKYMLKKDLDNNEPYMYDLMMLLEDEGTTSSTKVYLNPDYDPEKYDKLYEERRKALARIAKYTKDHIY